jgi:hypothetical protein
MKAALIAVCLLCATAAAGQATVGASALSSEPQAIQFRSHEQRAAQGSLATPQDLQGNFAYGYAKGERPLWEFAPASQPVPLGDVARALRKEHATAKKADVVWVD